jgi:hypothetical protein
VDPAILDKASHTKGIQRYQKKFLAFYGSPKVVTVFTRACQLSHILSYFKLFLFLSLGI